MQLLTEPASILRDACPDLQGRACYVVCPPADDELCRVSPAIGGYFHRSLDAALQQRLETLGLWEGPGLAMVIPTRTLADGQEAVIGTALHECSHWLDCLSMPVTAEPAKQLYASVVDAVLTLEETTSPPTIKPWRDHEGDFLRAALHLQYRCPRIPLHYLSVAGKRYGLSPDFIYRWQLRDELHDRSNEPIRQILDSPAPPDFVSQFKKDIESHEQRNQ